MLPLVRALYLQAAKEVTTAPQIEADDGDDGLGTARMYNLSFTTYIERSMLANYSDSRDCVC